MTEEIKPPAGPNDELRTSEAGLALIKESEGLRLSVYRDVAGFATIGYGHRVLPSEDWTLDITEPIAESLLAKDVAIAEGNVRELVTVALTQGEFDALVDFDFELGGGRLRSSTLLKLLNSGQKAQVPWQLYHKDDEGHIAGWVYAGGEVQAGMVTRREREIALWNA